MGILLAFAPFIAFAVIDRFFGATAGLSAGALVSAALLVRDFASARAPKILEIGTFVLFAGMALFVLFGDARWSVVGVRLRVDAGLLAIVLVSMAARQPFTLQYARERVDRELWSHPAFLRTNYVITGAWALAFGVMVVADLVMLYLPQVPIQVGILATVAALVGAVKFTSWYPQRSVAGKA
ncbi:hypothetical protein QTI33_12285 [Variovorax sp. J22P271]|uniref:hypothetical protein n=1 Tax=Variovorax davisae TaxID=3053515 RepID=UPI0025760D86|nr:hypothetical protein [Variovorax sp. J22P271]MDM0032903.1 hypothetical protein [Variovorax sp. J22P271]